MTNVDRDALFSLYVTEGLPMHEVANRLGVATGTVYNRLKRFGIETRPPRQGLKGKTHTPAAREAIRQAHIGMRLSPEAKQKISEANKAGGIGHKKQRSDGYIYVYFPDHPKSTKGGYIMEHDLVMECLIGRHLYEYEVVHHKNHNRADNRKENLQLMTASDHAVLHLKERHERMKNK